MRTPKERERDEAAGIRTVPKPKRTRKADTTAVIEAIESDIDAAATLKTYDTEGDLVDIWERRMLNPDVRESKPIRINIPGMRIRWINLVVSGRYQRARYDEGWVPVKKNMLVDPREIYGVSYSVEGFVCRGEKQTEMLMMMPEAVARKIGERRRALIEKSQRNLKDNMLSAGEKHFSDKYNPTAGQQIAETAANFKGSVSFGTEKVDASEFLADRE